MSNFPTKTICFFNSNRAWGGGEKWHFTTAKEFQRRGHKVMLVTNHNSELSKKAIADKLSVYSFFVHNLSFLNPFKILTIYLLFKKEKVDAVIMNLPSDLKLAGIAAKLAGVKKVIYRRGMPHPIKNTFLNRFLFQKVLTHIVVNSLEIGRSIMQGNESWIDEEKMLLVYNGVDTQAPIKIATPVYQKQGNEIVIGNAGRLTEQKGQKYLIEMSSLLKNEGFNFKLLIAGEGELRQELQTQIQTAGLTSHVILLGHVDDMAGFMKSLDVFVFPSLFEGSANTLIETLQYGVPSVAFNVSSNPEIIQHNNNGLLAEPFNVYEFTQQVKQLIHDSNLRKTFSENGQRLLLDRFDSKKNLAVLEKEL